MSSVITIEERLTGEDRSTHLAELAVGLAREPLEIPSKLFYDHRGSALFERITELPEYYQTRTEQALLESIADRVVAGSGARELLELGSGAATKTRVLLDAMARAGTLERYLPYDFSPTTVHRVAEELAAEYPGIEVHGIVDDFVHNLNGFPAGDHRLVVFLGSTIGNFEPDSAARFLERLAAVMEPGDHFLLGADLIKSPSVIEAAYNDREGVTAEFNRNILRVANDLAEADFRPELFAHRAFYDEAAHRIEMWLEATRPMRIELRALDRTLELAAGEAIRTEISTKYDRRLVTEMLDRAGFVLEEWYTDPASLFALVLAERRPR